MTRFTESMDALIEQAEGRRTASVTVDQVYAHYQESRPELHHPDGGQAFYLRDSVYLGNHMATLARSLIDEYGLGIDTGMREVAENIARGVYQRAPREFNDLRRSSHVRVTRGDSVTYERLPEVGRLSEGDLRLKHRLSYLFDPHRYRR